MKGYKAYNINMKNITSFSAVVQLPKAYALDDITIDVELDKDTIDVELDKDEEHLTYDEVEDAIVQEALKKYCYDNLDDEDYPYILDLVINKDGESYPVVSESMDDSKLRASKEYTKYLVIPEAQYELTPEAKLCMQLKHEGIIDADAPFDFEKYHSILEKKIG